MVSRVPHYTGCGKFWVFFVGVSTRPVSVDFQCRVCKDTFDRIDDPEELARAL